jgi:prepilin-type N-terminal cleavage/methylation domain-containing protein
MKIPFARRQKGFTLIELLVVITIILVLAGGGFAAGNSAIQRAKKATALATATALETAVNNFFTEYGSMPKDGSADLTINTETDTAFLNVLLGLEGTGPSVLNTRGIKFLQAKDGKAKKNGLTYTGTNVEGLYDPWGAPYNVMLDLDYNEQIIVAPKGGGGATLNGRRVAVWSDGADGVPPKTGKPADDAKTWGN